MGKIQVAIIGCGAIFGIHADAVMKSEAAELIAVVDIRESAAKKVAARYNCEYYTDYREMLKDPRIQAVQICTPHHLHALMAIEAMKAGKHVLTEKPVAISLKEATEMTETAIACKKHLAVCFQNRFNPTSVKAKEVIDSGLLGDIKGIKGIVTWYRNESYYAESDWRGDKKTAGGGVLINQAIHTLDLMQWFGGNMEGIKGHVDTRCLWNVTEVEDTAEATIYFKNGARGIFYGTNCYTANSPVKIEIHCEKGLLSILDGELYMTRNGKRELLTCDQTASGEKAYWGLSHEKLIEHYYECLLHSREDYISASEAATAIEMIEGIYESSRNNREYLFNEWQGRDGLYRSSVSVSEYFKPDTKIAAQLYTLREFLQSPEDIVSTLKRVKEIGYNAVQVSGMGAIDRDKAELVKKTTEELGLTICATHVGFDQLECEMDWMIELHKMWNCRYVGLGSMPDRFRDSKEGYLEFAKIANGFGRLLNENGLRFIYHNHNFEFHKFDGLTGMEILLNETDPNFFDFELDTYWVQAGGADPIEWIKRLKGRMDVVHFKDMVMHQGQQTMAEVGEGNLNWPGIIDACREIGAQWVPVEQDICLRDPFESLKISLNNLKKYGARHDT